MAFSSSFLILTMKHFILVFCLFSSLTYGKSTSSESQEKVISEENKVKSNNEDKGKIFGNWINTDMNPNINPTLYTIGLSNSSGIFGGGDNSILPGTVGTIGASAVLVSEEGIANPRTSLEIKGGFLTLLTAIKSIVVPAVLTLLLIAFLIAGAAFFTCSLVDCQGSLGNITGGGGSNIAVGNPQLNRQTFDYYDHFRPIYKAIDEGQQKYGTSIAQNHGKTH